MSDSKADDVRDKSIETLLVQALFNSIKNLEHILRDTKVIDTSETLSINVKWDIVKTINVDHEISVNSEPKNAGVSPTGDKQLSRSSPVAPVASTQNSSQLVSKSSLSKKIKFELEKNSLDIFGVNYDVLTLGAVASVHPSTIFQKTRLGFVSLNELESKLAFTYKVREMIDYTDADLRKNGKGKTYASSDYISDVDYSTIVVCMQASSTVDISFANNVIKFFKESANVGFASIDDLIHVVYAHINKQQIEESHTESVYAFIRFFNSYMKRLSQPYRISRAVSPGVIDPKGYKIRKMLTN